MRRWNGPRPLSKRSIFRVCEKSDISSLQTQIEGCVKDSDLAAKIVAAIESSLADGALQENLNSLKSGILEEIAGIYATQETLESVQETLEI